MCVCARACDMGGPGSDSTSNIYCTIILLCFVLGSFTVFSAITTTPGAIMLQNCAATGLYLAIGKSGHFMFVREIIFALNSRKFNNFFFMN